jgi:hypothetical protein
MAHVLEPHLEQQPDVSVVERVVDIASLLAVPDQPTRAQQTQIVRTGRLGQARHGREIANAEFSSFKQRRDQPDSPRISQDAESLSEILKDVLAGKTFEDNGNALWVDALDLAAIKRYNTRLYRRCRYLRTHEDIFS